MFSFHSISQGLLNLKGLDMYCIIQVSSLFLLHGQLSCDFSMFFRGHSTTTWTKFWPISTPSPPSSGQAWTFYIPPPLSTWTKGGQKHPLKKNFINKKDLFYAKFFEFEEFSIEPFFCSSIQPQHTVNSRVAYLKFIIIFLRFFKTSFYATC